MSVDVMVCDDTPTTGYMTASTLGLHRFPNQLGNNDIRVEICGIFPMSLSEGAEILGTAAFYVMGEKWLCAPGVVFPKVVRQVVAESGPEHLLFVAPAPFQPLSRVQVEPELAVHWLLAVPIYDSEAQYLAAHGLDALESELEKKDAAFYDLGRPPVV